MNILFILPQQPSKFQPVRSHQGIQSLSGFIKSRDNTIKTHLLRLESLDVNKISSCLERFKPGLVCITSTSLEIELAVAIGNYVHKNYRLPTILGGIHATIMPEDVLNKSDFDAICRGEGEEALFEFIQCVKENKKRYDIRNFYFKKENAVIHNPLRDRIENLDILPYPDWELLYGPANKNVNYAEFLASRGCPFSCSYCAEEHLRGLYEKKNIRFKSPAYLIGEIKEFKKRYPNLSFVFFHDDNFNLYKNWLIQFCDLYSEHIKIPFGCNLHYNLIDEEIVLALKKAGCFRVHVAIETGNERLRKEVLNKNIANSTIIESSRLLKKHGIRIWTFNILGIPNEKKEHMLETIKLNKKIKPDYLFISCFYPLPGSKLYDTYQNSGKKSEPQNTASYFADYSRKNVGNNMSEITYYRNLFPFMVFYPVSYPFMKIKLINAFIGKLFYSPVYMRPSLIFVKVLSLLRAYLYGIIRWKQKKAAVEV